MVLDEGLLGFAVGTDGTLFVAGPGGLRRSSDGGRTWRGAFEADGVPATAVAIDAGGTVFAAVPGGIGRSHDGGETWVFVRLPEPAPLVVSLAAADDGLILAGTMQDGVLISDDGGESWQARNAGLFDPDVRAVTVFSNLGMEQTAFAATSTGLFRSVNGGRLWRPFSDLPTLEPLAGLAALANGTLLAIVEGAGLWRSNPGGARWSRIAADALPDEIDMIVISPLDGTIVATDEDRAFRSRDEGETWIAAAGIVEALEIRASTPLGSGVNRRMRGPRR